MWSGPVGLAAPNSTLTRSAGEAPPAPKRSPASRIPARESRYQASAMKRLRKPGPAISTFSTDRPSRSPSAAPLGDGIAHGRNLIVIGLAGEDLVGAVELLQQHHPRQLVWQRHRAQRQPLVRLEVEPLGTADHEAQVAPVPAALLEPVTELLRAERLPVARQQYGEGPVGDAGHHLLVLAHLHVVDLHVAGEHLAVVLDIVLEGRAQPAHGYQGDPHPAAILRACPRTPSAISTSIRIPRRWRATTPTSPTSPIRTTSSRSLSPGWTTRSRRARCRGSWSRGSTSRRASCAS